MDSVGAQWVEKNKKTICVKWRIRHARLLVTLFKNVTR